MLHAYQAVSRGTASASPVPTVGPDTFIRICLTLAEAWQRQGNDEIHRSPYPHQHTHTARISELI